MNPQSLNRYAYVYNNPLRYTDPTGHYIFEENPDDSWIFDDPQTRSQHYYTHPEYECGTPTDAELFIGVLAPIWIPAAGALYMELLAATTLKVFLINGGASSLATFFGEIGSAWIRGEKIDAEAREAIGMKMFVSFAIGGVDGPFPSEWGRLGDVAWGATSNTTMDGMSRALGSEAWSVDDAANAFMLGALATSVSHDVELSMGPRVPADTSKQLLRFASAETLDDIARGWVNGSSGIVVDWTGTALNRLGSPAPH